MALNTRVTQLSAVPLTTVLQSRVTQLSATAITTALISRVTQLSATAITFIGPPSNRRRFTRMPNRGPALHLNPNLPLHVEL